jgi:hypothetical protein
MCSTILRRSRTDARLYEIERQSDKRNAGVRCKVPSVLPHAESRDFRPSLRALSPRSKSPVIRSAAGNQAAFLLPVIAVLAAALTPTEGRHAMSAKTAHPAAAGECRIEGTTFEGWQAQQITNRCLRLILVPKLGGRLMQVTFAGHSFLFINPKYRGRYFPPSNDARKWFNYGGDKIWPMPEGTQDDQHWPGPISDPLDDGDYAFHAVSQGAQCVARLEGPADPRTGLQYTRQISIDGDSPHISFRAIMKNAAGHPVRWSVQSVTQYDTSDPRSPGAYNHDFWAFTPANARSSYVDGYHVRAGVAEDPAYAMKNGVFSLHWSDLQGEVWVDSPAGWLAVVDASSQFAMIERFRFDSAAEYPGKATVIFYKNGPAVGFDSEGKAIIRSGSVDVPFYMEAELNSPTVRLAPNDTYSFDTEWFPTRIGSHFETATNAGVVGESLAASATNGRVELSGTFGVFYAGRLVGRFWDQQGRELATIQLGQVDPAEIVNLHQEITAPQPADNVTLVLIDDSGIDRGALGQATITHRGRQ